MTNEQMLIDRRQLRARLEKAIDDAAEAMPEGAELETLHQGFFPCLECLTKPNPEHQVPISAHYVALRPLRGLLISLDADIATLEGGKT